MSFTIRNLSVAFYCKGFSYWHYKAKDAETLADLTAPGYLQDAKDMFAEGDVILITHRKFAIQRHIACNEASVVILSPLQ